MDPARALGLLLSPLLLLMMRAAPGFVTPATTGIQPRPGVPVLPGFVPCPRCPQASAALRGDLRSTLLSPQRLLCSEAVGTELPGQYLSLPGTLSDFPCLLLSSSSKLRHGDLFPAPGQWTLPGPNSQVLL